jgi:hypothetical protein
MDRPLRENCKEFGMEKFLALLLASLLLAGCHTKPTAEQERQSAEVARQNDEAARNRQAEDAARKLREELGDEIRSQVNDWYGPDMSTNHNLPPGALNIFTRMVGWRSTSSRMFINRNTGVLTIELHCQFSDTVGNYNVRSDSPDYSTQYLPLLVRLFDDNGQYLTHFETSEIYGKSVMNRNSDHNVGGHYMKELQDRTVVQYSINKRDAAFVQIGEVGQVSH